VTRSADIKDKLPPTDSRLRPDQRSYEEGDQQKADQIKEKLEQNQRSASELCGLLVTSPPDLKRRTARREKWEKGEQEPAPPIWFKEAGKEDYQFKGEYWEKREKKDWPSAFGPVRSLRPA
jgi:hypothetical protein